MILFVKNKKKYTFNMKKICSNFSHPSDTTKNSLNRARMNN